MTGPSLEDVRAAVHRLFIGVEGTSLRKEDEQKCRELAPLLGRLARLRRGAHLVDAAAGKASVGLVAAELSSIGSLTVIERDAARVRACLLARERLARAVPVDVRAADVGDAGAWPERPDAVVALHSCGPAADVVIDQAIRCEARLVLLVPCCYGASIPFFARADDLASTSFPDEELLRRRLRASLIDLERRLRLEAAGYETSLEELVGATVTPHNLLFTARRTNDARRIERAETRLADLLTRGAGSARAPSSRPSPGRTRPPPARRR